MSNVKGPLEAPILYRLSADEHRLIQQYRTCTPNHQQNIRIFASTASSISAEESPYHILPFAQVK